MGSDAFFEKRKKSKKGSTEASHEAHDDYLVDNCPMLYAFLCQRKHNGVRRTLGSVTIFADEGKLKFSLNDRDNRDVGFGSLVSSEAVFDEVEAMMVSDSVEWRPSSRGRS